jgi:hypothetical protein
MIWRNDYGEQKMRAAHSGRFPFEPSVSDDVKSIVGAAYFLIAITGRWRA